MFRKVKLVRKLQTLVTTSGKNLRPKQLELKLKHCFEKAQNDQKLCLLSKTFFPTFIALLQ